MIHIRSLIDIQVEKITVQGIAIRTTELRRSYQMTFISDDDMNVISDMNDISAFFKEFSLGGQNREKRHNEKFEPSRFGERASLKI